MQAVEFKTIIQNGSIKLPELEELTAGKEVKVIVMWEEISAGKNYDIEELERLFTELEQSKAFSAIQNPSEWQSKLRDEWE